VHIERLDTHTIANQVQALLACVVQNKRKHADESVQAFNTPLGEGMENDFGVSFGRKVMATRLEVRSNLAEIVNFSVKDNTERTELHRLMTVFAQIQDRQTRVTQSKSGIGAGGQRVTAVVRPAMVES